MLDNHTYSKHIAEHIVDALQIDFLQSVDGGFQFHNQLAPYSLQRLRDFIHPYVSNDTYEREKQIVQRENLRTLVFLARTVDTDNHLNNLIEALEFKVVYDKNQL